VIPVEAQKTEPDKNTYLVLRNQKGADREYDYGTHFLFQGHELAVTVAGAKQGYITRTQPRRRHDAPRDAHGDPTTPRAIQSRPSTARPGTRSRNALLFTTESTSAPTYAATVTFPSEVEDVSGALAGAATRASRTTRAAPLDRRGHRGIEQAGNEPHGAEQPTSIGTCRRQPGRSPQWEACRSCRS